jgi:metal-dependent HD superfamily phosphatase/phosphodiesterase
MELVLSDEEARTLYALLSDYLHDLRREVARTEAKDFRHALVLRQNLVERLLGELERERVS